MVVLKTSYDYRYGLPSGQDFSAGSIAMYDCRNGLTKGRTFGTRFYKL